MWYFSPTKQYGLISLYMTVQTDNGLPTIQNVILEVKYTTSWTTLTMLYMAIVVLGSGKEWHTPHPCHNVEEHHTWCIRRDNISCTTCICVGLQETYHGRLRPSKHCLACWEWARRQVLHDRCGAFSGGKWRHFDENQGEKVASRPSCSGPSRQPPLR